MLDKIGRSRSAFQAHFSQHAILRPVALHPGGSNTNLGPRCTILSPGDVCTPSRARNSPVKAQSCCYTLSLVGLENWVLTMQNC